MDIIFHGEQPTAAVPGGSSFNSIISVGRAGVPAVFIGETGNDEVGRRIADFMTANHVDTRFLQMRDDIQSAVSLAFLNERHDARYMFYKQPPRHLKNFIRPGVNPGDVVQFGSYYAINPHIRPTVKSFLEYAHNRGAILFYDLNYRRTYKDRATELLPAVQENFRLADIVRGSADDFEVIYGLRNAEDIYHRHIEPFCRLFICTCGAEEIAVCTPQATYRFPVPPIHTVSTIGAGDNFNAGFICALIRYGISRDDMPLLSYAQWERLTDCGRRFSANVCASIHNSIDEDFGQRMAEEWKQAGAETRPDENSRHLSPDKNTK